MQAFDLYYSGSMPTGVATDAGKKGTDETSSVDHPARLPVSSAGAELRGHHRTTQLPGCSTADDATEVDRCQPPTTVAAQASASRISRQRHQNHILSASMSY